MITPPVPSPSGWTESLELSFQPHRALGLEPARVFTEHRSEYVVACASGDRRAVLAGRLRDEIEQGLADPPAVGDWVALNVPKGDGPARLEAVLPRRTAIVRRAAGVATRPQVVAANVDVVFIATALPHDVNPRRLERYLALVRESGASAVLVLTKADLSEDLPSAVAEVSGVAPDVPVVAVSLVTGEGLPELDALLPAGGTVAVIGSSGVGKSTLINRWLGGEALATGALSADGHGRHTTTARSLYPLPSGGFVLDTPGMREVGLMGDDAAVDEVFSDVGDFATGCRFGDCSHEHEPGCAVREALESGLLPEERYESFRKLKREAAAIARRTDEQARTASKQQVRAQARAMRQYRKGGR